MIKSNKYKEKTSHGNSMFPFYIYEIKGQNHILKYHWHNELEIIILKKGRAIFQLNSSQYILKPDQAIIINSGAIHNGYSINQNHCQFYAIVFDLKLLKSSFEDICQLKYIDPIIKKENKFYEYLSNEDSWSQIIIEIIKEIIITFFNQNYGYELKLKSLLYELIYSFLSNNKIINVKNTNNYKKERLKTVLSYIHDNYNQKLYLKDMARTINLSKYYFCKFFKEEIGKTPIEYLNNYRILEASKLIQEKDEQIMDISLSVGFDNISYFNRQFKKYHNCTPLEYRNKSK